ncbi:hypothetical protein ACHQM5_024332 [Ranunculus cassubicifolius]
MAILRNKRENNCKAAFERTGTVKRQDLLCRKSKVILATNASPPTTVSPQATLAVSRVFRSDLSWENSSLSPLSSLFVSLSSILRFSLESIYSGYRATSKTLGFYILSFAFNTLFFELS